MLPNLELTVPLVPVSGGCHLDMSTRFMTRGGSTTYMLLGTCTGCKSSKSKESLSPGSVSYFVSFILYLGETFLFRLSMTMSGSPLLLGGFSPTMKNLRDVVCTTSFTND